MADKAGAKAEWGNYWPLPIAAALGYATSVIHIYGLSPYIVPVSAHFGWDRATVTFGLTIATLIQAVFGIPIGLLVDRLGPRALGVIGVPLTCAAFATIGLGSDDQETRWYLLWALMAFATLPVQATVWTAAVATRFEASRGLAFAVTLCGASLAQAVFPWLGSQLISSYGWQTAMAVQSAIWAVVVWPVIFLFFRGSRDPRLGGEEVTAAEAGVSRHGMDFKKGLRSTVYLRLMLASFLFTFVALALVVNFIAIQIDAGMTAVAAGSLAFWIGSCAIIGRLVTGLLLDRLNASLVGAAIFLLPMLSCLNFLFLSPDFAIVSAVLIGLTVGAEVDVIVFLAIRYFGLKAFGGLYGGLLVALSLGTALGPWAANILYDSAGSYEQFLWIAIGCMAVSAVLLASLPKPDFTS